MTTRQGLAVVGVTVLVAWLVFVTVLGAWGTAPADKVVLFWSAVTFFGGGLGIWLSSGPTRTPA